MICPADKKVVLFGCPLDCDEKHEAIQEKLSVAWHGGLTDDPLLPLLEALHKVVPDDHWHIGGALPVPGWLRPIPPDGDRERIDTEAMVDFIDRDGCREYAEKVEDLVASTILPNLPCMVTVDHSLTGGVYTALAKHYGRENLSLIVVDSHTDAVPMSILADAIAYDMDTNPQSLYDPMDPFLQNRAESYNASTFIHHLVEMGIIAPSNLYIVGVSDYPDKRAFRIKDRRIANYVAAWTGLKQKGATIITKKECQLKSSKLEHLLKKIRTPFVYVSIDMDIGACNAVEGVRFKNWRGLAETQIYRLVDTIVQTGGMNIQLVGMDITEVNSRVAGKPIGNTVDRTYQIAANLIQRLAFDSRN
jgi:arginase family enzyme